MTPLFHRPVLLTTRVVYFLPDYSHLVNEFIFQQNDSIPDLSRLHLFLDFWRREIHAVIRSVEIAHIETGGRWRGIDFEVKI